MTTIDPLHAEPLETAAPPLVAAEVLPPVAAEAPPALCQNCTTALLGPFCHQCGQAVRSPVREFFALLSDGTAQLIRLDGKLLQTLKTLYFRPGALVSRYLAGQRMQFVKPLKLYLSLSLVLFLLVKIAAAVESALELSALEENSQQTAGQTAKQASEPTAKPDTKQNVTPPATAIPAPVDQAPASSREMKITINGERWDPRANPAHISWLPEWGNRWLNKKMLQMEAAARQANHEPGKLFEKVLAALPTTMFLLVPVAALLLKLLYFYKKRLYAEHLLVSVQAHSFMFLSLIFITLLRMVEMMLPRLDSIVLTAQIGIVLWSLLYLFLLQKRVYGQHFLVTVFMYGVAFYNYLFLLGIGVLFTTLGALANY
jgi:Protein of unknown function (DUF3667)